MAVLPSREVTVRMVQQVGFGMYSDAEARKLSVKRLTSPITLDTFGNPLPDGLYDPALGLSANETRVQCVTCGLGSTQCPGHFGHIELPIPVYNPLLLKELLQLVKSTCWHCHRLRLTAMQRSAYIRRLRLLLRGKLSAACSADVAKRSKAEEEEEGAGEDLGDEDTGSDDPDLDADGPMGDLIDPAARARAQPPLTSNVLTELSHTITSLFKEIGNTSCPLCKCIMPKVKKVGKFRFMAQPLSAKQEAKNVSSGISLRFESSYAGSAAADADADGDADGGSDDELDDGDFEEKPGGGKRKRASAGAGGAHTRSDFVGRSKYLDSHEVHKLVQRVWSQDSEILDLVFQAQGGNALVSKGRRGARDSADMFFVRTILVPPNKFRPISIIGDQKFEHAHNVVLVKILQTVLDINDLHKHMAEGGTHADVVSQFMRHCQALQNSVSQLIDSTASEHTDGLKGVRQLLEKKEGLFRMNMMGKRVNFAARSVISPDPYIGTGEIGVPPFFAKRLSFPEPVTHYNLARMKQLVINGADVYPGALAVEDIATGVVTTLSKLTRDKRESLAKLLLHSSASSTEPLSAATRKSRRVLVPGHYGKIVYRQLIDGDIMLTNRQPTLHKPGLMAHRARVLHGERTIRFHYANCATFNADFDGDEINLHLPQEHQGRAEGYHIVHADHQFKVPTDGKPVRGLIQDHVVGAVNLTSRDTFLDRAHFLQLCHVACTGVGSSEPLEPGGVRVLKEAPIVLPPPALVKPYPLWTGKQVINTLMQFHTAGMPPVTFNAKTKTTEQELGSDCIDSDAMFAMRRGYLCHGCLDKAQYGKGGLLHASQELYGGPVAGAITSSLSRLFTTYVQQMGFTCGMGDLLLTARHETARADALADAEAIAVRTGALLTPDDVTIPSDVELGAPGDAALRAAEAVVRRALRPRYRQNALLGSVHDQRCSSALNPCASAVTKSCFPRGLVRPFRRNCMSLMTSTGAKGGLVNFSQITAMLGQQDLEGRRVPRMASGKTLPCFHAFDAGARSCGFIADRFLTGLRPQEYYFHCMAGRDGLVDTAVKTARSGYLQRCMIKNLEGLKVGYDATVRDESDNSVVQFIYGDDGLDVLHTSYLDNFPFLRDNIDRVVQGLDFEAATSVTAASGASRAVAKAWTRRSKKLAKATAAGKLKLDTKGIDAAQNLLRVAGELQLPCLMEQRPSSVLGVTSEFFGDKLQHYLAGAGDDTDAEVFARAMNLRYMRSLVAPGEAVGIIAGQSIGEPSTQMTLNTFHMAGRGEANVTLGIPRLRELLMTAAKAVKTPVMKLPLRADRTKRDADELASRMRKLRLAECLQGLAVVEQPFARSLTSLAGACKRCVIELQLHPMSDYPAETKLSWAELMTAVVDRFVPALEKAILTHFRQAAYVPTIDTLPEEVAAGSHPTAEPNEEGAADAPEGGTRQAADLIDGGEDDAEDDENREGNEEFAEAKDADRGQEMATYDDEDDDEEDDVIKARSEPAGRQTPGEPASGKAEAGPADASGDAASGSKADASPGAGKSKQPAAKRARGSLSAKEALLHSIDIKIKPEEDRARCEVHVSMPINSPKVLMRELAEATAVATLVRSVAGIDKVFVVEGSGKPGDGTVLQTDGLNFEAAWDASDVVDVNGLTCNDVTAMLQRYGVEAARATLVQEVRAVFGVYGIGVDARHLSLIGDFMMHGGAYRACNRIGIGTCASPLLKMSFETSATFLKEAALRASQDRMTSAAARIVLGLPVALGTGAVSLRMQDVA